MTKAVKGKDGRIYFKCPGCNETHCINEMWQFNNNFEKPSISPSIMVNRGQPCPSLPQCHSYVTDGRIQFMDDCSHDMKGQTVDLPDYAGEDLT